MQCFEIDARCLARLCLRCSLFTCSISPFFPSFLYYVSVCIAVLYSASFEIRIDALYSCYTYLLFYYYLHNGRRYRNVNARFARNNRERIERSTMYTILDCHVTYKRVERVYILQFDQFRYL